MKFTNNIIIQTIKKRKILFKKNIYHINESNLDIPLDIVINSRCTSDFDKSQKKAHWGIAKKSSVIDEDSITFIIDRSVYNKLTDVHINIDRNNSTITIYIEKFEIEQNSESYNVLIDCGQLIQSILLTCSALGVSTIIKNLGTEGKILKDERLGILSIELAPMSFSYNMSYWSDLNLAEKENWKSGKIKPPNINKLNSYGNTLLKLGKKVKNKSIKEINELSQILWAAKGRTPHFYLSKEWGVTIPLAYGIQDRTFLLIYSEDLGIQRYVNWDDDKPTHNLKKEKNEYELILKELKKYFYKKDFYILLCSTQNTLYSYLEIGFMLHNIKLETVSMGYSAEVKIDLYREKISIMEGQLVAIVAI